MQVVDTNVPQAMIAIGNISWDISKSEVIEFLNPVCRVQDAWIHIPIDRNSGKTIERIYVEIPTIYDAYNCTLLLNKKIMKGRLVTLSISSHDDALQTIVGNELLRLSSVEIDKIINICLYPKFNFSKKCPNRPIEYAESLVRLLPWYKLDHETGWALRKLKIFLRTYVAPAY